MSTSDRELLELAAKAAGIQIDRESEDGTGLVDNDDFYWNPLLSDGDALRLAVKLQVFIQHPDERSVVVWTPYMDAQFDEYYGQCWYAATRRAIVRAAAEIGRSMP